MPPTAYYIAPYIDMFRIGGGQFSLTDPGGGIPTRASRVLIYGTWLRDVNGSWSQTFVPISTRGRAKNDGISFVEADAAVHAAIQADPEIQLVPFAEPELDNLYSSLDGPTQSALEAYLESIFINPDWIVQTTVLRDIVSYVIAVLAAGQQLGPDYPDRSLNSRWNGLESASQDAVQALLAEWGLPAITGNPTIRQVQVELASIPWPPIRFGNEFF